MIDLVCISSIVDAFKKMGKLKWSDITTQTLLRTLHEQALQGEKAENGFKKKAWIAARVALKDSHDIELETTQLKSKWANVSNFNKIYYNYIHK